MRPLATFTLISVVSLVLSACGYHTVGSATHLPTGIRTLSIPVFAIRTNAYHTEAVMTQAVVREFALRTRLRVLPEKATDADATLSGVIVSETSTPLTYNSQTQQSSSYVITIVVAVTLTASDGRILYKNDNYTYREQYQATTDLNTFLDESPAAVERLSRNFARQLVADVTEGM